MICFTFIILFWFSAIATKSWCFTPESLKRGFLVGGETFGFKSIFSRLRKFDAVVHASIRNVTQDNYCIFIEEFKSSYLKLQNTSVTLIAYAVLFHVPKFATAIYWASIKNKQQNHSIITSTITGNGSKGILIIQTTLRIF